MVFPRSSSFFITYTGVRDLTLIPAVGGVDKECEIERERAGMAWSVTKWDT